MTVREESDAAALAWAIVRVVDVRKDAPKRSMVT